MNIISKLIKYIKEKRAARKEAEFQKKFQDALKRQKEEEELRKYIKDNDIHVKVVNEKPIKEEKSFYEKYWEYLIKYGTPPHLIINQL